MVGDMVTKSETRTGNGEVLNLSGGTEARVRSISPDDGPALMEFHEGLSDRSRFLRYFSPHPFLSPDEILHLTCVDGFDRVALVVELKSELIAVGRFDRLLDTTQAEVAFVVADAYQHHHIATELLHRLARIARMAGVVQFRAEVLAENSTMLSVFREAGFPVSSTCSWGTIELTMDIAPVFKSASGVQTGTRQMALVPPVSTA
jgi:GNAT superfamily N-acetyltransferase